MKKGSELICELVRCGIWIDFYERDGIITVRLQRRNRCVLHTVSRKELMGMSEAFDNDLDYQLGWLIQQALNKLDK